MPSETKAFKRIACIVGNQNLHQNSSGRAQEGRNPLAPRPRGGVGEQSAPRPRRRKQRPQKDSPHRRKRKPSKEQTCIVGNQSLKRIAPGRAREGRSPLAPRRPRGSRGAERPTPSETKAVKRIARFVGNKNPCQNSHGRAREDVNPLDFQSRLATCASERLLAQRAGKSLCDRPSEIKDFGWSPRVLIFSERGLALRRKNRFLADSAPGNPQDFSGI